jgi:hypothetical protein
MRTIFPIVVGSLLLALGLCVAHASPSNVSDAFELERFEFAERPPAGGVVLINRWGDVRVKQGSVDRVAFNAVVQLIGETPHRAEMNHRIEGDRLIIEVDYPAGEAPETTRDGRIDAGIVIPSGMPLELHSDRGRVMTQTLDSPLTVRATDGSVQVKSRSRVDLASRDGDILFNARGSERPRDLGQVRSERGDIEIQFARDLAIRIDARTGASITTNDPELLQTRREQGRRSQLGRDDSTSALRIDSDAGRILLVNRSRIPGARPDDAPTTDSR